MFYIKENNKLSRDVDKLTEMIKLKYNNLSQVEVTL